MFLFSLVNNTVILSLKNEVGKSKWITFKLSVEILLKLALFFLLNISVFDSIC